MKKELAIVAFALLLFGCTQTEAMIKSWQPMGETQVRIDPTGNEVYLYWGGYERPLTGGYYAIASVVKLEGNVPITFVAPYGQAYVPGSFAACGPAYPNTYIQVVGWDLGWENKTFDGTAYFASKVATLGAGSYKKVNVTIYSHEYPTGIYQYQEMMQQLQQVCVRVSAGTDKYTMEWGSGPVPVYNCADGTPYGNCSSVLTGHRCVNGQLALDATCGTYNCGNGVCDSAESASNCPADCKTTATCGDGVCSGTETSSTCLADCHLPVACGNGACDSGETTANCAADCPAVVITQPDNSMLILAVGVIVLVGAGIMIMTRRK